MNRPTTTSTASDLERAALWFAARVFELDVVESVYWMDDDEPTMWVVMSRKDRETQLAIHGFAGDARRRFATVEFVALTIPVEGLRAPVGDIIPPAAEKIIRDDVSRLSIR